MKASELIKVLTERIEEHGDNECYYLHDGRVVNIEEVLPGMTEVHIVSITNPDMDDKSQDHFFILT